MIDIAWKDDYYVGDVTIDSQHRYLFLLANELLNSRDKAELTHCVMKLFHYVHVHFDHEEAVMRRITYPAYREHVAMHEALITGLSAISDDIHRDLWPMADLQQFMNGWLAGHIVTEDTKLCGFIRT